MKPFQSCVLLFSLMAVVITACSGAPAATAPSPEASPNTSAASQIAANQPGLPGTEEFGLTKEELVRNVEAVEALIAQCMRGTGFDYVAVDYDTVRKGMVADKSLPGVKDQDYIAQYGYGISTLYTGQAPQLAGVATPAQIGLGEQNVKIFKGLAATDQVAYNRALFGENTDATFAVSLEVEDFSRTGGCTQTAVKQVFIGEQLRGTYTNPLDALIQQDARMITALTEFADCVRVAGFNYNHPNEVEADIKNRLNAITKGAPVETLLADAQAALTELQGEERAIAVVSRACEATTVDPVAAQIESEYFAAQP